MNLNPVALPPPFRIGEGWDTHALVPGRKLILVASRCPTRCYCWAIRCRWLPSSMRCWREGWATSAAIRQSMRVSGADSVVLRETGWLLAERGPRIISTAPYRGSGVWLRPHIAASARWIVGTPGLPQDR
jgi:2-C-methyl-D-erythritol 2,4-cyclodiphosphate synthase